MGRLRPSIRRNHPAGNYGGTMTGICPLCGENRELREIEGTIICSKHLSSVTWERRSTEYPRNRLSAPSIIEVYSQTADHWIRPGYDFISSSAETIATMMNEGKTQVLVEPFFGEHIREGIAIVKDWIKNPKG
jgi:hypothetical protein